MLAPSEWSSQGSQSSQCSSNATGSFLLQISAYFSPPPRTPSKCYLMHVHVRVSSYFYNVLETKAVLPSLACKFVYQREQQWLDSCDSLSVICRIFSQTQKSTHQPQLLLFAALFLGSAASSAWYKRNFLLWIFYLHIIYCQSLSFVSIDSNLSKGHLSFLWGFSIRMALRKP